jgi:hypothetical protein
MNFNYPKKWYTNVWTQATNLYTYYRRMHRYLYHPAVAASRSDGFPASSATRMACATAGLGPFDACRASGNLMVHIARSRYVLDCRVRARGMSLNQVSKPKQGKRTRKCGATSQSLCVWCPPKPHTFTREIGSLRDGSSGWGIPGVGDGTLEELMDLDLGGTMYIH